MYNVLNTLSEDTYFYISNNITSYTCIYVFPSAAPDFLLIIPYYEIP